MPELMFYRRGEEVLRVGLERQYVVLGRGEDCDVVIPDPHVSRQQVALVLDGTHCLVEDLSGQGTEVAGQLMRHGELPDGADLKLGQWRAVFRQRGTAGTSGPTRRSQHTDVQSREGPEDRLPAAQVRVKQGTTEFLYPIGADSFTVGKDPANALVVRDRFISSQHLQVTRCETGFHVRDLNSTNGTFAAGLRLFEAEIPMGTVLRVGETELLFEPAPQGQQEPSFHGLVGNDPAMRQLVELLQRVAPSNAVVTVLGESGTGKELVAWALHEASPREGQPFIPLNCAALAPAVIESELFGHEKGAFTGADSRRKGAFEEAHGSTLFLDEVDERPLEPLEGVTLGQMMQRLQHQLIESTLSRCNRHKDRAAKWLLGLAPLLPLIQTSEGGELSQGKTEDCEEQENPAPMRQWAALITEETLRPQTNGRMLVYLP